VAHSIRTQREAQPPRLPMGFLQPHQRPAVSITIVCNKKRRGSEIRELEWISGVWPWQQRIQTLELSEYHIFIKCFTDTAPSSFSGGPTSPTTPFAFSPDNNSGSWMPSQQARLPPPGNNFQRPRSQTFPMLGIDPSFISSQSNEPLTPKYNLPVTAPSSALESPIHEMPPPFGMDSAISSPPLHHSSSNGSMAPPSSGTPITGLQSPPGSSAPSSPTQDDARRALDTLLNFFNQAPNGLVDQNEYMTV
jgi:hypothetical protein